MEESALHAAQGCASHIASIAMPAAAFRRPLSFSISEMTCLHRRCEKLSYELLKLLLQLCSSVL